MTRFDADDPGGRQKLVADAVAAHRERGSAFLTLEADGAAVEDGGADGDDGADEPGSVPWVQYAGDEGVLNLDCTDAELERLDGLLAEFPAFKVRERTEPEEAEGTNLKVGALADAGRIGQFVDRLFRDVYGLDEDFRLWVTRL